MTDTTTSMSAAALATLLAADGIDATDITNIIGTATSIEVETTTTGYEWPRYSMDLFSRKLTKRCGLTADGVSGFRFPSSL